MNGDPRGALGFAHVGVVERFERLGVSVDMVVGTGVGPIAGAPYSVGYDTDDLAAVATMIDWVGFLVPGQPRSRRAFHEDCELCQGSSRSRSQKELDSCRPMNYRFKVEFEWDPEKSDRCYAERGFDFA